MGHIVRYMSDDGCVVVASADTADIVQTAQEIHSSSKVCTAALGRLITASSLMGVMLKGKDDTITLRVNGQGPIGSLIAVADSSGNPRGYMMDSHVELPLNEKGKLDVGKAVGTNGCLSVIKDVGLKEPSIGQVPLVSGEIAEDITSYYAVSEQVPTVCALGVLMNTDLTVAAAGGFIIQLLPTADDSIISRVEEGIKGLESVTAMLASGLSPDHICRKALPDFTLDKLDEFDCAYMCTCSRQAVEKALIITGKSALEEMAQDSVTEVKCHFCPQVYRFTPTEIRELIKNSIKE